MATNWNDPEINPRGFVPVPQASSGRTRVSVPITVKVHSYFTSADGHTYVCVFIDETKKRAVYLMAADGFVEVTDEAVRLTIARMTDEMLESQIS